ncbi:MAG: TetR/AcrR family transcriptional regulator [Rickettsiales bacterium]|nr:TetR/AcrR family transcriptional regulator [Rickettsiales bacterium]
MPRISHARVNILDAAHELFWNNSYESVGVEAICQQAGVKKGSFYHFFATKEAVALTLLDQIHTSSRELLLTPAFTPDIPVRQRFDRFLEILAQLTLENHHAVPLTRYPGCPIGNMILELSTKSEALRVKLLAIIETYTVTFQEAIEESRLDGSLAAQASSRELAEMLVATWQGGILMAKVHNESTMGIKVFQRSLQQIFTPVSHPPKPQEAHCDDRVET